MSALLEIRQLDKHFGGLHVLKHFNMTLQAGEIVGILGPNGAGTGSYKHIRSHDTRS